MIKNVSESIYFRNIASNSKNFLDTIAIGLNSINRDSLNAENSIELLNINEQQIQLRNDFITIQMENLLLAFPEILSIPQEDLSGFFEEVSNYRAGDLFLIPSCQSDFNKDIKRIHKNYDRAIATCVAISIIGGGVATPCFVAAVTYAIVDTANAIDSYSLCCSTPGSGC